MNKIDLTGRVAVITGGAQGIGYATAERMLASGASVVLWDRNPQSLAEAEQALSAKGSVKTVLVELVQEASVKAAAESTLTQCGKVDILVNNAGITGGNATTWELDSQVWQDVIQVNLVAPYFV